MTVRVIREHEVVQEATEVLVQHLAPAKVARFLAAAQVRGGDYLALRAQLFAGETVATLVEKIRQYQGEPQPS